MVAAGQGSLGSGDGDVDMGVIEELKVAWEEWLCSKSIYRRLGILLDASIRASWYDWFKRTWDLWVFLGPGAIHRYRENCGWGAGYGS